MTYYDRAAEAVRLRAEGMSLRAIGKALKDAYGIDLRVLPGKNDISRQIPLREKQVDFSATGIGATYFAQEGVFEFGAKQWGPQAVRTLVACNADSTLSVLVAKDSGVKTLADGKRVRFLKSNNEVLDTK